MVKTYYRVNYPGVYFDAENLGPYYLRHNIDGDSYKHHTGLLILKLHSYYKMVGEYKPGDLMYVKETDLIESQRPVVIKKEIKMDWPTHNPSKTETKMEPIDKQPGLFSGPKNTELPKAKPLSVPPPSITPQEVLPNKNQTSEVVPPPAIAAPPPPPTKDVSASTDLFGNPITNAKRDMRDFFLVPPFSIINTVDGDWNRRKKKWKKLINDNGESRENTLYGNYQGDSEVGQKLSNFNNGVSLLDPCMAEVLVKWFTEEGHTCFDPFAGDTIFGYVSSYLGRPFKGIELRKEQADFNQQRCKAAGLNATYYNDTSENTNQYIEANSVDFVFSCPPYFNLEVYSDLPNDISNMTEDGFFKVYKWVLQNTYTRLKDNRFACVVTSEVRDKKTGAYIGLVPRTIAIMQEAGYMFYNDIILVTPVGTLPLRSGKTMNASRKVGRRHQNILVFYKGDPKQIKNNYGELIPKNEHYEG